MRQTPIESTSELRVGMIVQTGSAIYHVTDHAFPAKFRGHVYDMRAHTWGSLRDVPLPSPCHGAYEVTERHLFPPLPA